MNKINYDSKIWDLHIHSKFCNSSSKGLKELTTEEYVDNICNVFDRYDDLEMISFTDHNLISVELYEAFYNKKSSIQLLPGVEVDVKFNEEDQDSKHLVIYFDAMNDINKIDKISVFLSTILKDISPKNPINVSDLLSKLLSLKIEFVISPHAFKQGKRAIDYDWHSLSKEERDTYKYVDQLFSFWEASGHSEIAYALQFLKEMNLEEKISIISFSDSKDFIKLENYLDHPTQYFNALPSFKGLKMVGSEINRIYKNQKTVDKSEYGNLIKTIDINGCVIELSSGLNAIIGGRGSGKSLLLDSISACLDYDNCKRKLYENRMNFLKNFSLSVYNFDGQPIQSNTFVFDYFNQAYISKLFTDNRTEYNKNLKSYFSTAFNKIEDIDVKKIESANDLRFRELLCSKQNIEVENISGLIDKYTYDLKDLLDIKIPKNGINIKKSEEYISYANYTDATFIDKVNKIVPKQLQNNDEIKNSIIELNELLLKNIHKYNDEILKNKYLHNFIVTNFNNKKSKISVKQQERTSIISDFKNSLTNEMNEIKYKVDIINCICKYSVDFKISEINSLYKDGAESNSFRFCKELHIEHPLDYCLRVFETHLNMTNHKDIVCMECLMKLFREFCFGNLTYKSTHNEDMLIADLLKMDLKYEEKYTIAYKKTEEDEYIDIMEMSPGTQTNILMEYIVHEDSKKPLLIDQPEDNIDNQTIFKQIREWFYNLKNKRQVIVVTHDANIVINADADNVIIAKQKRGFKFEYTYGALEYGDNLEIASEILDGGKDAVRRRLLKYGG